MAMVIPRGRLRDIQCSHAPPSRVRSRFAAFFLCIVVLMCSNFAGETTAAELARSSDVDQKGAEETKVEEAVETGDKVVTHEHKNEVSGPLSKKAEARKARIRLMQEEARAKNLSIKPLLDGDFESTIQEVIEQADSSDVVRLTWKKALESHRESLGKRGKVPMNVSLVAKAQRMGDLHNINPQPIGYILGRLETDGVFVQSVYSPLPFPVGAKVCERLLSRFLEAATKEAGVTHRVTAFVDSSNLNACQALNKLGFYPADVDYTTKPFTYKWLTCVPYTHPTGFFEKLVEKESQKKQNLIEELRKVCRSERQLAGALKGKEWLSRNEVLPVEKDGDTMHEAQEWLLQRQEFSSDIGIFAEENLEFGVCFIARSKDTNMVLGVVHGQYTDKKKEVLEIALLLETVGDTRTGLHLLEASLRAIPDGVTKLQAMLPFREIGSMQALLQCGMSFSGMDLRNSVFGLKVSKDALDFQRLELHKSRQDLRCEIERMQQTLDIISAAEKRKQKTVREKAKAKEEDDLPLDDGLIFDSKTSILPFPLREPWTDLPTAPSSLFPRKPRESEHVETGSQGPVEPSKLTEEELPSRAKSDEDKAKHHRLPKEEAHSDRVDSEDQSRLSGSTIGALAILGVASSLALLFIKRQKEESRKLAKRREAVIRAAEMEVENDIADLVPWHDSNLPDYVQSLQGSASAARE